METGLKYTKLLIIIVKKPLLIQYAVLPAGEHQGPVWCAKFSLCGRLLATAGQDQLLRVFVIKQAYHFFIDIRSKYNPDIKVTTLMLTLGSL